MHALANFPEYSILSLGVLTALSGLWLLHPKGYSKRLTEDQRSILILLYLSFIASLSLVLFLFLIWFGFPVL
jgi:hypothetical protein